MAMDPLNANRVVAWVNGTAAANNGGTYLSTNALAPTPTFAQTLVTTTASVRGELAGNNVARHRDVLRWRPARAHRPPAPLDGRRRDLVGVPGGAGAGFCGAQCFYDIAVAVHPTNANIVNLGGDRRRSSRPARPTAARRSRRTPRARAACTSTRT